MIVMLEKIDAVLEQKVRPSLHAHGGDIQIQHYENGVLTVKLLGQCSDCPAAMETTQTLVAAAVTGAFPEVKEVILDTSVNQELLDFARKLLCHETV